MTLNEAIKHAEEEAKVLESTCALWKKLADEKGLSIPSDYEPCKKCAEEHRQLAEWLKELKTLKEEESIVERVITKGGMTLSLRKPNKEIPDLAKVIADALGDITVNQLKDTFNMILFSDDSGEVEYRRVDNTGESYKQKYDMAIKAIHDIKEKVWEIDIPSPTIPEYVEHHEQVRSVLIVIYNWLTKLEEAENE